MAKFLHEFGTRSSLFCNLWEKLWNCVPHYIRPLVIIRRLNVRYQLPWFETPIYCKSDIVIFCWITVLHIYCDQSNCLICRVYKLWNGLSCCGDAPAGIPNIRWFGIEGVYNVLVLDLLGWSLEDLLNFCNRTLSLKTMLMLADQLAGYFAASLFAAVSLLLSQSCDD